MKYINKLMKCKICIVLLITIWAVIISEIVVYIQLNLFWSDSDHRIGYILGFWTPLISGSLLSIIFVVIISLYEKKLLEQNENLEQMVQSQVNSIQQKEKKILEQSRLAQMGEMISMIAHQWRQPLGAISSAVVSIQNKLGLGRFDLSQEADRVKFEKFLYSKTDQIEEYIEFLTTTIDEFRNFYKKDKQKVQISLDEAIKQVLKIVKVSLENKGIELILNLNDPKTINIFKNQIMQVFLNILKNSEDNFIENLIDDKRINISTTFENNTHIVTIRDNGGGISEDILPNIFQPYFSTKQEKNGTGLGLYMSKTIIEEHHSGSIEAKNRDDGVEFTIALKDICNEK